MPRTIITSSGDLVFLEEYSHRPEKTTVAINNAYYAEPVLSTYISPPYPTVNNDPEIRKRAVRHFYGMFKDVWIYSKFKDLADFFAVENDNVVFKKHSGSEMTPQIAEFITDEVINKKAILKILYKYVERKRVNWYDLKDKHSDSVKKYMKKKIEDHIERIARHER